MSSSHRRDMTIGHRLIRPVPAIPPGTHRPLMTRRLRRLSSQPHPLQHLQRLPLTVANLSRQPRQRRRADLTSSKLASYIACNCSPRSAAAHAASRASTSFSSNSAPATSVARSAAFIFARSFTPAERRPAMTAFYDGTREPLVDNDIHNARLSVGRQQDYGCSKTPLNCGNAWDGAKIASDLRLCVPEEGL